MDDETRKRLQKTQFVRETYNICDDCFGMWSENGLSVRKVAIAANLSPKTVRNLQDHYTVFPHWLTVWKVVSATGMELALKERPGREPPATAVFTNRPAKKKKKKTKK